MEKYIALLRGVNVGGKNIISMPRLKAAFSDVVTYIQSGNILFCSEDKDAAALQQECRRIIADSFGLDIPVAVISAKDLRDALTHAPEWWDSGTDAKHNAIFVIAPATAEDIIEKVGEAKPEYERVAWHGPVIFWTAPLETFSRTRWSKVSSASVYGSITIRNANTAKKLLKLSEQQ